MSKYEFKPNIGRLQKVMSSQEYGKKENKKIKDYVNPSKNRCGRESNIFEDKDTLKSQKDCPNIQHHIPNLMKGPKKKQFKKDEMFEVNEKEKTKKTNKKKSKEKTAIKEYKNEFHFN